MIIQQIKNCIVQKKLFTANSKILVAISGGIDSVVLTHALQKLNYNIELAHCNFKLRGEESDADQMFVQKLAEEWNLKVHFAVFDTNTISQNLKINTQETARKLRYDWFEQICQQHHFQAVATAHNADDQAETILINIGRGCGISGLHGIPYINNKIVRPLLNTNRNDIETYAKENRIMFRVDSSNLERKYTRNKLRHDVIPILKKTFPNFIETITKNTELISQQEQIYNSKIQEFSKHITTIENQTTVELNPFKHTKNGEVILFELLKNFQFSFQQIQQMLKSENLQSGQKYISRNFISITHQSKLIIKPNSNTEIHHEYWIESPESTNHLPIDIQFDRLSFRQIDSLHNMQKNELFVDAEKIKFPLLLRKWKNGDRFYPFGLNGSKKVQDYFGDIKLNLFEKQNVWILESHDKIVWIVNHRADRRFAIDNKTEQIFKISVL